ncbi:Leucinostatins biosynthesis cluster protein T [Pseudocercospora fuligena]|uniref:Leucinostatins biosynthesis cluster protein T n=1 Tax=Pseudocercospora fuligena TaxID=685502 RepID=A0A8H6RHT6_9PEZI|nr:Leucinostatins biosynthesis cluster protein T [Pseudocercospora fuligena]
MAHIILTGATGTVGAAVLAHAIATPSISRISILSRRPVKLAENEPKAKVILQTDFTKYDSSMLDQLEGATSCIWAQGISSRGMSEDEYAKITVDYPVSAARAFSGLSERFNFVYVSGEGADMEGKSSTMFGKIKGRAEKTLLAEQGKLPSLRVYNVRPATINPQGNYIAERKPTLQDKLSTGLGNVFEKVWKSFVIPTDSLAKVLVELATGDGQPIRAGVGIEADGRLLRNTAIRRLAGL